MGLSQVGLDPDRLATCGDRLAELALAHQRVAEVGISLSEVGHRRRRTHWGSRESQLLPRFLENLLRFGEFVLELIG